MGSFVVLFLTLRFLPRVPAALVVLVLADIVTAVFGLDTRGVAILGTVPAGLPPLRWPTIPFEDLPSMMADAAGLGAVTPIRAPRCLGSAAMVVSVSAAERNRIA